MEGEEMRLYIVGGANLDDKCQLDQEEVNKLKRRQLKIWTSTIFFLGGVLRIGARERKRMQGSATI